MQKAFTPLALAAAMVSSPVLAQVYGSLGNFDAVNDTGEIAHGFEIQIQDPSFDHSKIYSVFGLDRNFGIPPTSVERYGAPTITDLPGIGVSVRYQASFTAGAWSVGTPTGPYPFAGDSCWPLGNAQYNSGTLSCDHFGIGTYASPAKVSYSWLVDPANTGVLSARQAAIPAVAFAYPAPPVAGQANPVVAEIDAHKEANQAFGTAYWVKVYAKHADHVVELGDLLKGRPDVPNDAQVETEFEIFQAGDAAHNANGKKAANLVLGAADAALVLRYEFYKYLGPLTAEGEASCGVGKGKGGGGLITPEACGGLGAYAGAQMAAFNAVQPPLAVPEPQTYLMLLAGLGLVGLRARRAQR
jgi:hypothetical protein